MPDLVQPEPPKRPQEQQPTEQAASAEWMYQNTVAYKEHIAHSSFLQTFKDYVSELQQQQLEKSKLDAKAPAAHKPPGKPTKPVKPPLTQAKPIPVNVKDTSQNLGDVHTYNATQAAVSQEINDLEDLIHQMVLLDPSLQKMLAGPLSQLQSMATSFPNLTSADMKNLASMFKLVENLASSHMTPSTQRIFYQSMISMMKKLQKANISSLSALSQSIQDCQAQLKQITLYTATVKSIAALFKGIPPNHFTEASLLNLVSDLKQLASFGSNPSLGSAAQATLNGYLTNISKIDVSIGDKYCSIADLLDYALVAQWMETCPIKPSDYPGSPNAYFQQVRAYLTQQMDAADLTGGPVLTAMGTGLSHLITFFKAGTPDSNQLSINFFTQKGSKVTVSAHPLSIALPQIYLRHYNATTTSTLASEVCASVVPFQQQVSTQIQQIQQAQTELTTLGGEYGSALGWAYNQYAKVSPGNGGGKVTPTKGKGGKGSGGSIADQVAHDVINNYMPRQQAYLEALAFMLMFDNLGATIGNSLLNYMSSFPNAGNQFNFASTYLNKTAGPDYTGSAKAANAQLTAERTNAAAALKNLEAASAKIAAEISKIRASHVSAKKKQTMINSLASLQGQLQQGITCVKAVQTDLGPQVGGMTATQISGKSPPEFSLSGGSSLSTLNSDENALSTGLQAIYTNTNSFQSFYSSGVTTQQAGLQVAMTEIQQEWTIVSTVLQLLNQSYMSVAQGIYKG